MTLQHPSRVGHAVTHGAVAGQLSLGLGGAIIGGAIAVAVAAAAGPEVALGTLVLAGLGGSSYGDEVGQFFGKIVDKLSAPAVAGHVITGFETVHLGPHLQHAARADEDTTADCAGEHVGWEGSDSVFLGSKPMSRVGDRLKCQGKFCEGEETIAVGGTPSQLDKELEEGTNPWVKGLTVGGDIAGLFGGDSILKAFKEPLVALDKGSSALGLGLDATGAPGADGYGNAMLGKDTITKFH
jgi:hypothetical protein